MDKACVRFYEELNDLLPRDKRKRLLEYPLDRETGVRDILAEFGIPEMLVDLVLINGDSVDLASRVHNGDRISVYPVFESFDIASLVKVRAEPLRHIRFIAPRSLARLVGYLRLFGFDVRQCQSVEEEELVRCAKAERRVLLVGTEELPHAGGLTHVFRIRTRKPGRGLIEILSRLDLWRSVVPFGRCPWCNAVLHRSRASASADLSKSADCIRRLKCSACGGAIQPGPRLRRIHRFMRCVLGGKE